MGNIPPFLDPYEDSSDNPYDNNPYNQPGRQIDTSSNSLPQGPIIAPPPFPQKRDYAPLPPGPLPGPPAVIYDTFAPAKAPAPSRIPLLRWATSLIIPLIIILVTTGSQLWGMPILPLGPTTITTTEHPTLIINSNTYTEQYRDPPYLRIHGGGSTQQIVLQAPSPWVLPLRYNQSTDKSTVILFMNELPTGNLDITVPTTSNLKINTLSSLIDVNGVTGQLALTTNSGAITVNDSTLQEPSLLRSYSGKIALTQNTANGENTFNNNTGAIQVSQSTFSGRSTFNTIAGEIAIDATFKANGTYQIRSNQGPITCMIPKNKSYKIDAATTSGSITSDFPGAPVADKTIHVTLGQQPRATLILYNNSGSIALQSHKGA